MDYADDVGGADSVGDYRTVLSELDDTKAQTARQ